MYEYKVLYIFLVYMFNIHYYYSLEIELNEQHSNKDDEIRRSLFPAAAELV